MSNTYYGFGVNDMKMYHNGKMDKWFDVWHDMLKRCYSHKFQINNPTYIGCTVCDEWLIASNFKKFYDENYVTGYELDKDLWIFNNKIYSPETCRFVPIQLNLLFNDSKAKRGDYPIGITKNKDNYYIARINRYGKRYYLGFRKDVESAYELYRTAKIEYVKEVADNYLTNGIIDTKLYNSILKRLDTI